jgi:hypothetical protein
MSGKRFRWVIVAAIAAASLGSITGYFFLSARRGGPDGMSPTQQQDEAARFNYCLDMAFCSYVDKWPRIQALGVGDYMAMSKHIEGLYKILVRAMAKTPPDIAWECLKQRIAREPQGRSAYMAIAFVAELKLACARGELRRIALSSKIPQYIRFMAALQLTYFDDWSGEEVLWDGSMSGDVLPPDMTFPDEQQWEQHRKTWRGTALFRLGKGPPSPSRVRRFCELLRDKRMSGLDTTVAAVLGRFKDDPLALSVLEEGLGDKSLPWLVRSRCAEALGDQGRQSSLPVLAKALFDDHLVTSMYAAAAIGKIIGQDFKEDEVGVEQAKRWWAEQQTPAMPPGGQR